jgi:hypothetical protein
MLTIFQIQHKKYQTVFGHIDLAQLYSAPWVKNYNEENSARCRCDSFFSRVYVVTRRSAFIYVLFKYSLRRYVRWLKDISTYYIRKIDILVRHYYNMFVTVKNVSHA